MHYRSFVQLGITLAGLTGPASARGEDAPAPTEETAAAGEHRRFYVGTSLFVVANLFPDPPSFYQLNVGWRPTERDAVSLEAITWTYHAPLGIPWGRDHGDRAFDYPGHVRDAGVGAAWQHSWWKGLYTQVHAAPLVHVYHDEDGDRLRTGFLLFTTFRGGYHVGLWRDRVFVEPSVACTWWPVQTHRPPGFAAADAAWPNFFVLEPGLHVGVNL